MYLPETQNDRIFTFLGDKDMLILMAYTVIFIVLTVLTVFMIRKRKDDKK